LHEVASAYSGRTVRDSAKIIGYEYNTTFEFYLIENQTDYWANDY